MDDREWERMRRAQEELERGRDILREKREEIHRRRRILRRRRIRRFIGFLLLSGLVAAIVAFLFFLGYLLMGWGQHLYGEYQAARSGYEMRQQERRGTLDPRFDGYTNVLILGIDNGADAERPGERHADTILVMSTENDSGRVRFITIPRETYITYPGGGAGRIALLYESGGAPTMVRAVNDLLGISIHQYVVIDKRAMAHLVDALGGLSLYVESDMDYDDEESGTSIHLLQGYQHLSGDKVVDYLSYRSPELGEVGRVQRQQKFVKALYSELLQLDTITHLPAIADIFQRDVETSAEVFDSAHIASVLHSLSSENPRGIMLPGSEGENGYYYPDEAEIERTMSELFNGANLKNN